MNTAVATGSRVKTDRGVPSGIPSQGLVAKSLNFEAFWVAKRLRVCNPLPPRISSEMRATTSLVRLRPAANGRNNIDLSDVGETAKLPIRRVIVQL